MTSTSSGGGGSCNRSSVWNLEGPYWVTMRTPQAEAESISDRESSAYTELDKMSSNTRTSTLVDAVHAAAGRVSPPSPWPTGSSSSAHPLDSEHDVFTHV